jgi:hypothetical protein
MTIRPFLLTVAALGAAVLIATPEAPASANGLGIISPVSVTSYGHGPACKPGGGISIYKPVNIYKPINIYKPVTINKTVNVDNSVNIYKPITITKNVNVSNVVSIYKPVTINKNIDITNNIDNSKNIDINKNVTINKNVSINKNITINKGGSASAEASAFAAAAAGAQASAGTIVYSGGGGGGTVVEKTSVGGDIGAASAAEACVQQEATIVKAIHAICVASNGSEFPASHMFGQTWIDAGYEGEIARCLPGTTLKVVIGDVLQSDQGMAGTYEGGQVLQCGPHEALRHYKDGMLKCVAAVPVPDCTERTNLRRYGTGDMFFSYRGMVCATAVRAAAAHSVEVSGMSLDGGVGDQSGY